MITIIPVNIPTQLRRLTGEKDCVPAEGWTIAEIIDDLEFQFPGIKERLCDENGKIRRFVNIFLNDEDVRFLKEEGTTVKAGDEISIVPAAAGG